jgi:selenocysteine lyase/cysteine desulfurase
MTDHLLLPGSAELRSLFPISKEMIFLNCAASSPLPLPAVEAEHAFSLERAQLSSLNWFQWQDDLAGVRADAARLLNADPGEIAFTPNTSQALSMVAQGVELQAGDEIVVGSPDFPSNIYPWRGLEQRGVVVKYLPRDECGRVTPADLKPLLSSRTRLLALSSVYYASGFAADVAGFAELCRQKGVLLSVDAIQSLGCMPTDVKSLGVHFLAAGCQKWLLGPLGLGLLYVDESVRPLPRPSAFGWRNVMDEEDFRLRKDLHGELKEEAAVLEPGSMNFSGIAALGASVRLLMSLGIQEIFDHVSALNSFAYEEAMRRGWKVVSPRGPAETSCILAFELPSGSIDAQECFQELLRRKVFVSARNGLLRLSPHCFNTRDEVSAFFEILDEVLGLKHQGRSRV